MAPSIGSPDRLHCQDSPEIPRSGSSRMAVITVPRRSSPCWRARVPGSSALVTFTVTAMEACPPWGSVAARVKRWVSPASWSSWVPWATRSCPVSGSARKLSLPVTRYDTRCPLGSVAAMGAPTGVPGAVFSSTSRVTALPAKAGGSFLTSPAVVLLACCPVPAASS